MRRIVDIPDGLDVDELMLAAVDAMRLTHPHPNPRVGAVVVSPDHSVLALGVCHGDGLTHAEVNALESLDDPESARGATMVVTLEPCSHTGRTGPCADALIDAGIARVVVGALDPDPRVSGKGIERLRAAGVAVEIGVHEDSVVAADPFYFHHRRTGRPFVTLKMASTIDGQVAAEDGTSRWITSETSRADAHQLRAAHDAVLVGVGTVMADDPMLDVRLDGYDGPQPRPIVITGAHPIPSFARLLARDPLVYGDSGQRPDLVSVIKDLGTRNILSVLVEGGPTIAQSLITLGLVDEFVWYIAGKIAGGTGRPAVAGTFATVTDAIDLEINDVTRLGPDIRMTATPKERLA